jgi:hypothetical protein
VAAGPVGELRERHRYSKRFNALSCHPLETKPHYEPNRREIDLAGDVRTMSEAAETLTEALGQPIAFAQTPIEQVRQYSKEMALMLSIV